MKNCKCVRVVTKNNAKIIGLFGIAEVHIALDGAAQL